VNVDSRSQSGVAMAIVLWFLAAMSLLVSGIVSEARGDVKLAQLHSSRAKAEAAGDGAISLTMASFTGGQQEQLEGEHILRARHIVGGQLVEVVVFPAAGLIDLNYASPAMLQALFEVNAGIDASYAEQLTDNLIQSRRTTLKSLEDFLRIEGATRAILDAIKDSVRVSSTKRGGLDLKASPDSVLRVVEQQNPERVAAAREAGQGPSDSRNTGKRGIAKGDFRVDARVTVGDKVWLRRRWVSTERIGDSALPWKISRSEASRVAVAG